MHHTTAWLGIAHVPLGTAQMKLGTDQIVSMFGFCVVEDILLGGD